MAMKLVSFVAAVFATCSLCAVAAPRLAFQVYAVRDLCERVFAGTLKAARAIGYEGVETGRFYGLDAKGLKAACVEAGLELVALQLYPLAADGVEWLVVKPTAHPDSLDDLKASYSYLKGVLEFTLRGRVRSPMR